MWFNFNISALHDIQTGNSANTRAYGQSMPDGKSSAPLAL
jgi:hypothetical protein